MLKRILLILLSGCSLFLIILQLTLKKEIPTESRTPLSQHFPVRRTHIGFQEARGYFATVDSLPPIIADSVSCQRYLGMAATMEQLPTAVDWDNEFLIAYTSRATDRHTTLIPLMLSHKAENNELTLTYRLQQQPQKAGYTIRPLLLIVVERKHLTQGLRVHLQREP